MNKYTKIAFVAGLVLVLAVVLAASASAMTKAEIMAEIERLSTLLGGDVSTSGSCDMESFDKDLTVGSKGDDVERLQMFLEDYGVFTLPAGADYGYFGSLTKTAVASYQKENGISPAVGYFGPITREAVNAELEMYCDEEPAEEAETPAGLPAGCTSTEGYSSTTGVKCDTPVAGLPAGCTATTLYSPTTGEKCEATTTTETPTGITTVGQEGTLVVTTDANPPSGKTIRESESKATVLGVKMEAKNSDLSVQRVKLSLGTSASIYTKVFKRVYLLDGDTVVAEKDMNSSTVFEEGSTKYIQLDGFSFIVPKDTKKTLTVAFDLYSTIDSTDQGSKTITVPANGVRAVDGAGLNQEGPSSTAISRAVTVDDTLMDASNLTVSLATDSPVAGEYVASEGSNRDEILALPLAHFNVKATGDRVMMKDWQVTITKAGAGGATAGTASLYEDDGTTLISSAAISSGVATFDDIDYWVEKDTTKKFILKTTITSANNTAATFAASTTGGAITAENSEGSTVSPSGTASSSEVMTVRNTGLQITLASAPTITTSGVAQSDTATNLSTSTLTATFNVKLKAVDSSILLGMVSSSTPAFASSTTGFKVYRNGSYDGTVSARSTTTAWVIPSGYTQTSSTITLSDGDEVTIPVTFQIEGRTSAGASLERGSVWSVSMQGVQWVGAGGAVTSNFMANKASWTTSQVSFP